MDIRIATTLDQDDVRSVHLSAFDEDGRDSVSKLAVNLLSERTTPQMISLVAESKGVVVGHVAFSPVRLGDEDDLRGYILAPLAVKPDFQKRGIGTRLVDAGMHRLSRLDVDVVFVYGDPNYYGRFGFSQDAAERYEPPYTLKYPFGWQALILKQCATGTEPVRIACVDSLSHPEFW